MFASKKSKAFTSGQDITNNVIDAFASAGAVTAHGVKSFTSTFAEAGTISAQFFAGVAFAIRGRSNKPTIITSQTQVFPALEQKS